MPIIYIDFIRALTFSIKAYSWFNLINELFGLLEYREIFECIKAKLYIEDYLSILNALRGVRTYMTVPARAPRVQRIMQKDLQEAKNLDFTEEKEYWNSYKLSDKTTLKIKLILQRVKRLKKWDTDGTPLYYVTTSNIVRVVNVPEELKGKPKDRSFKPV